MPSNSPGPAEIRRMARKAKAQAEADSGGDGKATGDEDGPSPPQSSQAARSRTQAGGGPNGGGSGSTTADSQSSSGSGGQQETSGTPSPPQSSQAARSRTSAGGGPSGAEGSSGIDDSPDSTPDSAGVPVSDRKPGKSGDQGDETGIESGGSGGGGASVGGSNAGGGSSEEQTTEQSDIGQTDPSKLDAEEAVTFQDSDLSDAQIRNIRNRARREAGPGEEVVIAQTESGTSAFVGSEAAEAAQAATEQRAIQDVESQLETALGDDVQRGEDYTVSRSDDGTIKPELTESYRQERQAGSQEELQKTAQEWESELIRETPNVDERSDIKITEGENELRAEFTESGKADIREGQETIARLEARSEIARQIEVQTGVEVNESDISFEQDNAENSSEALQRRRQGEVNNQVQVQLDDEIQNTLEAFGQQGSPGPAELPSRRVGSNTDTRVENATAVNNQDGFGETGSETVAPDVERQTGRGGVPSPTDVVQGDVNVDTPDQEDVAKGITGAFGFGDPPTEEDVGEGIQEGFGVSNAPTLAETVDDEAGRTDNEIRQDLDDLKEEVISGSVGVLEFAQASREERLVALGVDEDDAEKATDVKGGASPITGSIGPGGAGRAAIGGARVVKSGDVLKGAGVIGGAAATSYAANELEVPADNQDEQGELDTPEESRGQRSELEMPTSGVSVEELEVGETINSAELSIPQADAGTDPTVAQTNNMVIGHRQKRESDDRREISEEEILSDLPEPDQRGPSVRERQRRNDLNAPERSFPTGEETVIGRGTSQEIEDRTEKAQQQEVEQGAGTGIGQGDSPAISPILDDGTDQTQSQWTSQPQQQRQTQNQGTLIDQQFYQGQALAQKQGVGIDMGQITTNLPRYQRPNMPEFGNPNTPSFETPSATYSIGTPNIPGWRLPRPDIENVQLDREDPTIGVDDAVFSSGIASVEDLEDELNEQDEEDGILF